MASVDTHGFDAVLELGEAELDNLVACKFATGELALPRGDRFEIGGAEVNVDLLFDTPWVRLRRSGPTGAAIELVAPFEDSGAMVTTTILGQERGEEIVDLAGEVRVEIPLELRQDGATYRLRLGSGDAVTATTLTEETETTLEEHGETFAHQYRIAREAQGAEPDPDVVSMLENLPETVRTRFRDAVEDSGTGSLDNAELDVSFAGNDAALRVVDGPTSADRCLLVGIELGSDPRDHRIADFDEPQRPSGTTAAFALSSNHVLWGMLRPRLAEAFDVDASRFDYPCALDGPVATTLDIQGEETQVTIRSLSATVEDGQISVAALVTTRKQNVDVRMAFDVTVDVDYEDGDLSLSIADVQSEVHADLPWWVDVLSALGGFVGAAAVLIGQELIANRVENSFGPSVRNRDGLTDAERANELLDDRLGRMYVGEFSFDASSMVFAGSLLPDRHCRGAAHRSPSIPAGEGIDLDHGASTWDQLLAPEVDLVRSAVDGQLALRPRNGAKVGIVGQRQWPPGIDVLDLEGRPDGWWSTEPIPEASLPTEGHPSSFWLVFGTYTSEGRYAKCGARRTASGEVEVTYHTYDRPTPSVDLSVERTVLAEEQVGSGTDEWVVPNCAGDLDLVRHSDEYTLWKRSFELTCEARATLLARPFSYTWWLDGHELRGSDTVTVDGHEVSYVVGEGTCTLETTKGKALRAPLEVRIEDDRGLDFDATHEFEIPARPKDGGLADANLEEQSREMAECANPRQRRDDWWIEGPRPPIQRVGTPTEFRRQSDVARQGTPVRRAVARTPGTSSELVGALAEGSSLEVERLAELART